MRALHHRQPHLTLVLRLVTRQQSINAMEPDQFCPTSSSTADGGVYEVLCNYTDRSHLGDQA